MPEILKSVDDVFEQARSKFRTNSNEIDSEKLFRKWKQRHSNEINRLDYGLHISETEREIFSGSFYILSDIDRGDLEYGPAILKCTLKLSSKGIVSDINFQALWRKWYKRLWPF